MPFDHSDVPVELVEAARRRDLVLLVGAGFSKQADTTFPTWGEFLEQLVAEGRARKYLSATEARETRTLAREGQFLMAAEHVRRSFPTDAFRAQLRTVFGKRTADVSEAHRALLRLNPALVLTTNFDHLVEDAYAKVHGLTPDVWTYASSGEVQRAIQAGALNGDRPVIFKIHGTVSDPGGIILSEDGYRQLLFREPGYRMVLSAIFLTKTVLMLGFSFGDPELRLLLESHRDALKHASGPDYAFMPRPAGGKVQTQRLREDFGLHVIPYQPADGHPEVAEFLNYLATQAGVTYRNGSTAAGS